MNLAGDVSSGDVATWVGIAIAILGAVGGAFKFLLSVVSSSNPDLIAELRDRIDDLEDSLNRERAAREDDRRTYQLQISDLQREVRDLMKGRTP